MMLGSLAFQFLLNVLTEHVMLCLLNMNIQYG